MHSASQTGGAMHGLCGLGHTPEHLKLAGVAQAAQFPGASTAEGKGNATGGPSEVQHTVSVRLLAVHLPNFFFLKCMEYVLTVAWCCCPLSGKFLAWCCCPLAGKFSLSGKIFSQSVWSTCLLWPGVANCVVCDAHCRPSPDPGPATYHHRLCADCGQDELVQVQGAIGNMQCRVG